MRRPAFLRHAKSRGGLGARKGVHDSTEQSSPEPSSGYSSTDESPSSSIRSFPEATEEKRPTRGRQSARSLLTLSLSEALSLTMMESPPHSDGESCAETRKEETKPENLDPPARKSHDDKTNEGNWESDVGGYLSPLSVSESYSVPTKYSSDDILETSRIIMETLSASETDFNPRHSDEMSDANPQSHLFTYIAQEPPQLSPTRWLLGCKHIKKGATVGDARSSPFCCCDAIPVNSNAPRSTNMPVFFNEVECTSCEEAFQSTTIEKYFEKLTSFKALGIQNITCDERSVPHVTVCENHSSKVTDSEAGVDLTRLDSSHEDRDDLIMTYSGGFDSKPCHLFDGNDLPKSERSYVPATYGTDDELLRLTEADFEDQFLSTESQDIVLDSTDVPGCILEVTGKIYKRNLAESRDAAPLSPLALDCRDFLPRLLKPAPMKRQRFRHCHNSKIQPQPSIVRIVLLDHGYCLKSDRISKNSRKDTRRPIRLVQEDLSFESDRFKGNLSSVLARLLITRERLQPNEGSDWFIHTNVDTKSGAQTTVKDERKKERPRRCLKRGRDVSNRDEFNAGDRLENIKSSKQTLTLDFESHESGFQMEDVDLDHLELEAFDELWNNCFDPMKFAFSSLP